jgi:hypothetical protein
VSLSAIRRLEERIQAAGTTLNSKARTAELPELRYHIGLIDGMRAALAILETELNKETDGKS